MSVQAQTDWRNAPLQTALSFWTRRLENPLWEREMIQASRMTRTPLILMTLTILLTVITCAVGGIASSSVEPAELGSILYHVFFSLCFAVVCWVGPGVGTLLVTAEHTNRTWDALLLTGLSPRKIAQGKFMAAITYVGMYLVMLAPIGAVPFISGGVTSLEVLLAFVLLGVFTVLAVGFGIAVGTAMRRAAPAMLVSIVVSMGVSFSAYLGLGVAGAAAANSAWPGVVAGAPVWLPTAYFRAEFGVEYLATLVFAPLAVAASLAWLFFELSVCNMTPHGEDRVRGLKRWAFLSYPLLTAVALVPRVWVAGRDEFWLAPALALCFVCALSSFNILLLCTDDATPSRRVRIRLREQQAGWLKRWLAPGIDRTMILVLGLHLVLSAILIGIALVQEQDNAAALGMHAPERVPSLLSLAAAGLSFVVFWAGLSVWLKPRYGGAGVPRVVLLATGFVMFAGPWLVLAITGLSLGRMADSMWLAAPSPLYSIAVLAALDADPSEGYRLLLLQSGTLGLWIAIGTTLFILGRRRIAAQAHSLPTTAAPPQS